MRQILHIFRKDVRRHWPEILIGLVLLGIYAKVTLKEPAFEAMVTSISTAMIWRVMSAQAISPLLVFFWVFLAVRLVQGETLVGDRQWWVTKPYEWWKLLAAKALFLVVFVSAPLFVVQIFLLYEGNFSGLGNVRGVLNMQSTLAISLFLPSIVLGSLTRNLGQALLGIVAIFVGTWGMAAVLAKVSSSGMGFEVSFATGVLMWASIVVSLGWQYARRRTWVSRGVVLGAAVLATLIGVITPYKKLVERKYPLAEAVDLPVHISKEVMKPVEKNHNYGMDFLQEVYLIVPLHVSGVAPGHMVSFEGSQVITEGPDGKRLAPGWTPQGDQVWPEDERKNISYQMKRTDYERLKGQLVQLHIEVALAEYEETDAREIVLPEEEFSDAQLGICQVKARTVWQIDCRRPFQRPGLMARFEGASAKCGVEEGGQPIKDDTVYHSWFQPVGDEFSESQLNPVVEYPIILGVAPWLYSSESGLGTKRRTVHLCAGDRVQIAKPVEKRRARVRLDVEGVRLSDLLFEIGNRSD